MDDIEGSIGGGKKQIKTNDSEKKVVRGGKKKDDATAKGSPKRKNPKKKEKEEKKKEKGNSKKNKDDEEIEEIEAMIQEMEKNENSGNSDDDFESPSKFKSTKQKPQPKKNAKAAKGGTAKDEGSVTILEYMKKQNRPYSLINIFDNLHGEIKKPQAQKILDQLTDEGDLQMKEYGKAKIYLINQKNIPKVDPAEMENLKTSLEAKKSEHAELTNEVKALKKKEGDLNNQLTNDQLEEEIDKFENLLIDCEKKIKYFKSPEYVKIPDNVINEAEIKKNKYEKEYKKRRKYCMEIINQLAEGMEKKPRELEEMIGIERD